ncbi:hypothetical protein [Breoghania corrubedonensis]|nr:hypothetical protein [Breoghania corrubedonensis]
MNARRDLPAAARRCVRALVTVALALFSPAVLAQSHYYQSYRALSDLVVNVEMDPNSQVAGRVRAGTGGIRLNWCEPDIPAGQWAGADVTARRQLLAGRWCEVDTGTIVGNVRSDLLAPE